MRASRSSRELGPHRIEQDRVPKRRQSVPAHRGIHGPHNIDRCEKPLPAVPAASQGELDMSGNAEWVDELPYEVPIDRENPEEVILPPQESGGQGRAPPRTHICAQRYSDKGKARPNIPMRMSSMQTRVPSTSWDDSEVQIKDRDVLRGLHIAASAACNEQVDAYIRAKTGLHIRYFLANLMPLEMLDDEPTEEAGTQRARRSAETRRMKQRVRQSRQTKTPGPTT